MLKFSTGIQNWMLILIFGSKSGFGDDFRQYDTKPIILCLFFVQTPLRNSTVMVTAEVLSDQKLFERVCYMLKLKVTKFQLPKVRHFPLQREDAVIFACVYTHSQLIYQNPSRVFYTNKFYDFNSLMFKFLRLLIDLGQAELWLEFTR